MPSLPLELLYEVFHEDAGIVVLKQAALVCKALQHHAQSLLFKNYSMNKKDRTGIKPISASPHLLQHVRFIHYSTSHHSPNHLTLPHHKRRDSSHDGISVAIDVLKVLPMKRITGVELEGSPFDHENYAKEPIRKTLAGLLVKLCHAPNLRSLSLRSQQDFQLLSLCGSSVKELTVRDIPNTGHLGIVSIIPPLRRRQPMVLKALSVFGRKSTDFLTFALDPQSGISIDSLEECSITARHRIGPADLTPKLLERCQNSLVSLYLDVAGRSILYFA
jgi:hypothetical protein